MSVFVGIDVRDNDAGGTKLLHLGMGFVSDLILIDATEQKVTDKGE
jgi:hypothetical protein